MQTLTPADGRSLGYVEKGDPSGLPVIYQHEWQYPRL